MTKSVDDSQRPDGIQRSSERLTWLVVRGVQGWIWFALWLLDALVMHMVVVIKVRVSYSEGEL